MIGDSSRNSEFGKGCVVVLAFAVVYAFFAYVQAKNESDTFNRLTGATTTWHDALWAELRVQGTTD